MDLGSSRREPLFCSKMQAALACRGQQQLTAAAACFLLLLLLLKHEQPMYRQYGWCVLSFILLETRRYYHPFTTPQMLTAGPKQRITLNYIS